MEHFPCALPCDKHPAKVRLLSSFHKCGNWDNTDKKENLAKVNSISDDTKMENSLIEFS